MRYRYATKGLFGRSGIVKDGISSQNFIYCPA